MLDHTEADAALVFFRGVVEPTAADFLRERGDKRLGCLACLTLASMADHYFHARPQPVEGHTNENDFRRALGKQNWAFGTVLGVANATKHVVRKPDRVGYEDVSGQEITIGNLRAGWPVNGREVIVEVGPDNPWLLSKLVSECLDMWRTKLDLPSLPTG